MRSSWLTLAVVLTLGPLFRLFPAWIILICLAISAFSLLKYRNEWLLKSVAIGAACGVYLQYGTLFSREAGMALLALLVCLKLLELKDRRDAALVLFLGYFLILTWFFDTQSMPVTAAMLALVVFLTANLVGVNNRTGVPDAKICLRSASILLLQAVPFALVLFLLFPRIAPIWPLPHSAGSASSGLSDSLSPGSISNLVLSGEVAFRVDFRSDMPARSELYWRGPVLWDYDGRTWSAGKPRPSGASLRGLGELTSYDVMLEPSGRNWLFALDMPLSHPQGSSITADRQILAAMPVINRMRYAMTSSLRFNAGLDESDSNLIEAVRIPEGMNPKAEALARSWRGEHPEDIVRHAIRFYKDHHFVYTLSPPLLKSEQMDDFLFGTRSGFCEHYASSFAFLMRAAGVPARIVTGYQGGEINPIGRYLIVHQSDAHAWVEIWEAGRGWVRIDPTASVAPMRIESGASAALPSSLPIMMGSDVAWLRNFRFGWDAAANAWNQWVVGYGEEKQKRLFSNFGMEGASLRDIAVTLSVAISLFFLAATLFLLIRVRRTGQDRVQEVYLLFCRKMERKGMARISSEGPLDYANRIAALQPGIASRIFPIVQLYVALRYGEGGTNEDFSRFVRLVKAF